MKKLLAVLMTAAMCLAVTACTHNQKDTASKSSSKTASSSVVSSAVSSAASSGTSSAAASTPASTASSAPAQQIVTVTIPEGYCVQQIAAKLESAGVCSQSDFYSAVNSYAFTEACISQIPYDSNTMCYRLEGYLYPDTYQLYKNMKAQDAIGKMLRNADNKIVGKYDFNTVILASIIEKEAPDLANMKKISSVFRNRLNNPTKYPYLGSEATTYYLTKYLAQVDKTMNSNLVDKYKNYYNTNIVNGQARRKGLPAGPICSPGANALYAAANPDSTSYYNFGSDSSGNYTYS